MSRERFLAITRYIRASHVVLTVAAFAMPIAAIVIAPPSPAAMALIVVLAVFVAAGGSVLASSGIGPSTRLVRLCSSGARRMWLGAAVLGAAVALLVLVPDAGGQVTFAVVPLAWALRAVGDDSFWSGILRIAGATVLCGILVALVATLTGTAWGPLTFGVAALLAVGVLGQDAIYLLAIELDDLRELEAERAVRDERKRFAGDLHDIQGQHLGLITVEAELVRRLIAADRTEEAAQHAERVQQIAGEALDELHRVVHAYREVSLTAELVNAARVLDAAGIAVQLATRLDADISVPDTHDRLLGLTVREAVTNVLKHTYASSCRIEAQNESRSRQPGVRLTIADSGPTSLSTTTSGTGLDALQTRYCELEGTLEISFPSAGGAVLDTWLPIPEGAKP